MNLRRRKNNFYIPKLLNNYRFQALHDETVCLQQLVKDIKVLLFATITTGHNIKVLLFPNENVSFICQPRRLVRRSGPVLPLLLLVVVAHAANVADRKWRHRSRRKPDFRSPFSRLRQHESAFSPSRPPLPPSTDIYEQPFEQQFKFFYPRNRSERGCFRKSWRSPFAKIHFTVREKTHK